jgi:hypothetical protein
MLISWQVSTPHGLELQLGPLPPPGSWITTPRDQAGGADASEQPTRVAMAHCQLAFNRLNKDSHPSRSGKLALVPGTRLVLRLRAAEPGAHEPTWLTVRRESTLGHSSSCPARTRARACVRACVRGCSRP